MDTFSKLTHIDMHKEEFRNMIYKFNFIVKREIFSRFFIIYGKGIEYQVF